jgi:uncharacterized membrane protein
MREGALKQRTAQDETKFHLRSPAPERGGLLRSGKFATASGMSWLVFALSGPVLWAISIHFDKYLVERYFKRASVAVLLVFTAITGAAVVPVIALFRPDALELAPVSAGVIVASGALAMGALYFYLLALQTEEASVIAPFFQASPLFAAGLGYLVLGETLSPQQMGGGALVIGGCLLLSVRPGGLVKFKARLVVPMLACALVLALVSLIFKFFAVREAFWTTIFWTFVGQAAFGAMILAMPHVRRQFLALLRDHAGALLAINGANELINLGGGLGARYALTLAPIGLVQAITSTTALFVFIFGVGLSVFFPKLGREDLSVRELVLKGAAAVMIVIGVTTVVR